MARFMTVTLVAAIALGFAFGCTKTATDVETGSVEGMILRASLSDAQTKTGLGTLENGEYPVLWKTGDKISVNGTKSEAVTSEQNDREFVDFTVSGSLTAPYKVLYPGTTSPSVISLPATQSYVANSFDGAAAACWGNAVKTGGGKYAVSLNHFCGVIRFALKGSATLDRIELKSVGGEKLYGNFTLATNGSGFTGAFSGGTTGTLTYDCGDTALSSGSDTYFFVSIPAQTYSAGIEALVYQADGAFMRLKFWGSGYTLDSENIIAMESKTYAAGRTENLLGINSLTAEGGGEPTSERPGITVGVYNIKMAENRTGTNSTYISMDRADVQAGLGSTIAGMGADIFGINEIGEDNMPGETHDIKAWAIAQGLSSSDYTWEMDYPNKVSRSGTVLNYSYSAEMYYANVFAYNKNTITVEDEDYVWLSNDVDDYWTKKSSAYGHGHHTAVYAKCRHKVSGYRFWFIVTHFDTYYGNDDGDNLHNVKSFKVFAQHLKNDVEDLPIIAVGDLNFGSKEDDKTTDCPNYGELTSYWTDVYDTMWDAHDAAGDLSSWYYKTYNGTQSGSQHNYYYPFISFTKNHPDRRLDHIIYKNSASQGVTPTSYRTVRRTYEAEDENTWCPSDHLAVVAYMTFD